jgi:membrane fusion protein, copper/silver efflux system
MKPIKAAPMLLLILLLGGFTGLFLSGCDRGGDHNLGGQKTLYTCGMHPQVIQDHPGNCPICDMKLTPVRRPPAGGDQATNGTTGATNASRAIALDSTTVQTMDIRTTTVGRGPLLRTIRTVGVVDYDETTMGEVSTKFRVWIEKLHADSTGKQVHKGDPLFDIYSPDIYSAQTEYALALAQAPAAEATKSSALNKLKFFDIPAEQIQELERTR